MAKVGQLKLAKIGLAKVSQIRMAKVGQIFLAKVGLAQSRFGQSRIWPKLENKDGQSWFGQSRSQPWVHSSIRIDGGKTQVWNGARVKPAICEVLDKVAQAADPEAKV